ncbi:hypothetical protein [Streptomyces sp. NBC_01803]|uniref:hypothetical protein n=1 Tax=Streptomyces sp. NBC_01803 TaxID=2975946 RepID=UPI002DD8092B|nr:hypothetical protein [Streptomyces sp. NBC_01803]WSA45007.1 hypothetical protein OIE51_12755 [Streptomyces sp. NBC_01803]
MTADSTPTAGDTPGRPGPADPKTYRATIRRDRKAGRLRRYRARTLLSVCDLAERQGRLIPQLPDPIGFMGLGSLRCVLADTGRDADWFFVHEVLSITGATPEQWHRMRDDEIAEASQDPPVAPRIDEYTVHMPDGRTYPVPVCNWQMALLLALEGPWGNELMDNIQPALRRSVIASGLGDRFKVARLAGDGTATYTGETLTDVILADGPLPSAEVAKHQIAQGPFGALRRGDGGTG